MNEPAPDDAITSWAEMRRDAMRQATIQQHLAVVIAAVLLQIGVPAGGQSADTIDFDGQVRPLLTKRCANCHNATERKGGLDLTDRATALAGGDGGKVIEPGRPDESRLWELVSSGEMPPSPQTPLPDSERSILRAWLAAGMPWNGGALDPFQYTSDHRAGYDWWSLQPVIRPAIPTLESDGWSTGAIDRLVLARLHAAGLEPSAPTDRQRLIRRLYYDLLGLPPAPEEVAEFVGDPGPLAYERLVDRLLASPEYGERWARHWLDVIRFGESQGFERDKLRLNSWRYRDWVIRALNDDRSYQEFARWQLAGDVLTTSPDGIVATGFLVAGPYDEVGQLQQSAAMRAVVRQDELEDIIGTVSQTFLGLTVNCSRCHDHKFDPVRQVEYYRFSAALAGLKHGERELSADDDRQTARNAQALNLQARIRLLEQRLESIDAPVRARRLAERKQRQANVTVPAPIAAWEFDDLRDHVGELHGEAVDGAVISHGRLRLNGKGYVATAPLQRDLRAKTLEVWCQLAEAPQQGGGAISVQTTDGTLFDAIVFAEQDPLRWMAGSNGFGRTQSFQGPEEREASQRLVQIVIVYRDDGTILGYRDGQPYGKSYPSNGPVTFPAGKSQILFGLRHSTGGNNRYFRGTLDRARLYDCALTDEQVAVSAGVASLAVSDEAIAADLTEPVRRERARWQFEIDHLRQQFNRLQDSKTYAVLSQTPAATHLLLRGNPAQPGEVVMPGGIAALRSGVTDFGLGTDSGDADRRSRLAAWITADQNPLFARVLVNRLWHYHFGVGLVETPNDFGFNGGRPSHPQLINWLADELMKNGWSMKHVHRLIVLSATYRQASKFRPDAARVDADSRLLWRRAPQRLEAESLRDSLLLLAGELDPTMFGPGYFDFTTFTSNSQFYAMRDPSGGSFQRRSLYRTWVRSGRNPFLDVFDCPDPSTKSPQRAVTTTPLQALSLLNNSFVLRMAERLADRVTVEAGPQPGQQVRRLFQLAYGRDPDDGERLECESLVREHGLASLCRAVFNSNEFLYVD